VGGVVTSTFLVTIFAPLFYVSITKIFGLHSKRKAAKSVETNPSMHQ
jgi:HAE1 family hydrophobic/amphiphilic exporter-1